jgi:tetratricopeptide (TPR) repeat protein/V8-like Glu-specific endopeptidase
MRNLSILNAALIGTSIVLIQPHITVAALSAVDINKIATGITVKIVDADNSFDSGSGVIIKQTGNTYTVLTALHVVKEGKKTLTTADDKSYPLKNIKPLPDVDLAIAEFSSNQKYAIVKIGNSDTAIRTTTVYVAGFPAKTAAINDPELSLTTGTVNANGKPQRDGYNILYSNDTLKGMSGGAVLNDNGELVAIHGRADNQGVGEKSESKVITGLGITIYSALRQMGKVGVDVGVKPPDVVATAPKPDDFLIKGNEKLNNKDFRGALADYSEAIKLDPNYVDAYNNRGLARSELGDKQGALADYNQALKINPNYAEAYGNRGNARSDLGDKQGAIADFNQALKINSNLAEAYYNRGVTRSDLGDKQGAIADYTQALKINSNYAEAYYNRGVTRSDLGDQQGAIADYNQAIKINPNYAKAYYNRGIVRNQLGDQQGAVADYNQAIKINPNYAEAYGNRGNTRAKLGDQQGAIADYNQVIKINPNLAEAYSNRGNVRNQLGDKQGAITDYTQAIKINPNLAEAYYNRGIARYKLGDKPGAIQDLQKAGELFKQQGDNANYEQAMKLLESIKNQP